ARLARRLALAWEDPSVELEQPYPLEDADQKRLEAFGEHLAVCLPELGGLRPPSSVALRLRFEEGRLREARLASPSPSRKGQAKGQALEACVHEEGYALRLRNHREAVTVTVTLRAPARGS